MQTILKLLIIEDNPFDRDLLLRELHRGGFVLEYIQVDSAERLTQALESEWDIVTCDYSMPSFNAFEALAILQSLQPETPVIIVCDEVKAERLVALMKSGAWDYVPKSELSRLTHSIRREIDNARLIHQKAAAEKALSESEHRYRFITNNLWDSVWTMDLDLMLTWANPAVMRTRGYSLDELMSMSLDQHLSEHSFQQALNQIADVLEPAKLSDLTREIVHSADFEFRRKDGSTYWTDVIFKLIRDDEGRPSEFLCMGRDISDRLQMELELKKSEAKYRNLVEMLPQGLFEFDLEGWLIYANKKILEMIGYDESDLAAGLDIWGLFPPDEKTRIRTDIGKLRNGRKTGGGEYLCQRKDGSAFHVLASVTVLHDCGKTRGFMGTAMDISERIATEAEIRRLNDELEDRVRERTQELEMANRELEAFTYMASHDLRAPLRAIDGFARIVSEDYGGLLPAEGRHFLLAIERNAGNMKLLIDDLLEFARINRQSMQKSFTDMKRLVWEIIREIQEEDLERQVKWQVFDIEPVICDLPSVRQVLRNLISNAWKFTRTRPDACITIYSWIEGGEMVYTFEDNGVGFDMKHYKRLFNVFQRLHTNQEFEGTGVGLAIVQTVVSRHGGRTWASSQPGQGSQFHFSLPINGVSES